MREVTKTAIVRYRRAFRVGDRVKVGDVIGDVSDIRLQVTTVRTTKNEEVVIPNATILNSEIVNYTSLAVDKQMVPLSSALHRNIQDVFNEHGVQIMTPSYVADTPDAKLVPKDRWYAAPAAPPPSKPHAETGKD